MPISLLCTIDDEKKCLLCLHCSDSDWVVCIKSSDVCDISKNCVDRCLIGKTQKLRSKLLRHKVSPDSSGDGVADRAANLCDQQEESSDGRQI